MVGSRPFKVYLGLTYCYLAEKQRNKKQLKYKKQRSGAAEKQTNEETEKRNEETNKQEKKQKQRQ